MSVLDLFRKRAPERVASDEPNSPIYIMGGQKVRLLNQGAAMTAEVAQCKIPQMYRITNFLASSIQSVPWFCEPDPDTVEYEQAGAAAVKEVNRLLKSPNDTMTATQFQYWIAMNLMLFARAHFKVGVGVMGQPSGIYPLAAKQMVGILNSKGSVDKYEYGTGEKKETFLTRRSAERVSRGDPTKMPAYASEISFPSVSGYVEYNKAPAAIESLAMPLQIISALMQRARDTAGGHPNVKYVIAAEKTLTKDQDKNLRAHMEEAGPSDDNSGEILILTNTTLAVHKLDNDLGDIHTKIPLDDMTRQIAGVFGVPIPLLGLGSADSAKFAGNYLEARQSFWQDTIIPCYLAPIAAGMTAAICPPGARINFDLDRIPAIWDARATLGEKLSKITFLTNNEKRARLDLEPLEGEDDLQSKADQEAVTAQAEADEAAATAAADAAKVKEDASKALPPLRLLGDNR